MAKKICINCGKQLGAFTGKVNISDGTICTNCLNTAGIGQLENPATYATTDVKAMIASRTPLVQTFSPTKKIGSYLQIDDTHKAFKAGGSIFEFSVSSQVKYTYFRHKVHTFLNPVEICATLDGTL